SLLFIPFWAEEVNTACYVQNRVLVTKPHNNTPYELLHGRLPSIGFMRPFGCPVTILNTLDPLGKFQGKVDEGFLVGYSVCSKAFRVFNSRTRFVQETFHVNFMENKPNVACSGPAWLNGVNAASSSISTAGQNSINNTNDFTAAGPSNAAKPNLEDLSHDADDVGAEVDINNLEYII
nr:retrovirus-related Pol polyprotein from transposon TNT 1-94 [Tanacetum cinerariifolium]